ncbi:MAG TPA: hypothetical protein VMP01_01175 [Pirellulaceae bacterium]|nr:hypothetical protein [Pirellulaceae bacterium]
MTAADVPIRSRRIRAPKEDGAALIDPPLSEAVKLVEANRKLAQTWDRASGLPLRSWRQSARGALGVEEDSRPLIFSGHQPTLFHPGVWLKNFVLNQIAQMVGGAGFNLIVDNDNSRQSGISVPTGTIQSPAVAHIPLDQSAVELPFEERRIVDRQMMAEFPRRVHAAYDPLQTLSSGRRPRLLIDELWPFVEESLHKPPRIDLLTALPGDSVFVRDSIVLGDCLARARHHFERRLGLSTQEIPLSYLCYAGPFMDFVDHLLLRWPELHAHYNATLAEYRLVNHIRSHVHPAPDLVADGSWLEAPLWIWDKTRPQRRRAFMRRVGNGWELTDRDGIVIARDGGSLTRAGVIGWRESQVKFNVKVRPRALITTMFARLILSDLFIHGIGGAKYDELTDALIRRFFGIEPPAYVTATATFRLPIERPQTSEEDVRAIERRIRDTLHHGETFVDELTGNRGSELKQLAAEKKELIAARWQEKQKKAWHDRVTAGNERMSALLADVRQQLLQQREKRLADLHASNLLAQREFSFILFPEETLPRALLDLCAARP